MKIPLLLTQLLMAAESHPNIEIYREAIGLNEAELALYHSLTDVSGLISDEIRADPLLVLGVYSVSDNDRIKYARLYLKRERDRASKELAFLRIYQHEFERAAGNSPLIDLGSLGSRQEQAADFQHEHLVSVLEVNCDSCQKLLAAASAKLRSGSLNQIDLHFPDSTSESQIRNWAVATGIDFQLVQKGMITLNKGFLTGGIDLDDQLPTLFWRHGDNLIELTISERVRLSSLP